MICQTVSKVTKHHKSLIAIVSIVATSCVAFPAHAEFTFTVASGNLSADDDVQSTPFTLTQAQSLIFYTTSYAGGTNADGTVTPAGGFDPILTLFDSSGNTIAYNDDDTTGFVGTDPATGLAADSYFSETLGPGTYTLSISEYDNFASTDSSDWTEAGNPTFTSEFANPFNPLPGPFLDQTGDQRTSSYTYDIQASDFNAEPGAVPEPSPAIDMGLFVVVLTGLIVLAKRRRMN